MSAIDQIAYSLGRRDEAPNQELARRLTETKDTVGIAEIAGHLWSKNTNIASDCLKVLYETGYIDASLIVPYADDFSRLLDSKHNRMVWGAMIALATIAYTDPDRVWPYLNKIKHHIATGSVITHVWGVKALMGLSLSDEYYPLLIEDLLTLQRDCRPIDFAKRAEDMMPSIRESDRDRFADILIKGKERISAAGQNRVDRLLKQIAG